MWFILYMIIMKENWVDVFFWQERADFHILVLINKNLLVSHCSGVTWTPGPLTTENIWSWILLTSCRVRLVIKTKRAQVRREQQLRFPAYSAGSIMSLASSGSRGLVFQGALRDSGQGPSPSGGPWWAGKTTLPGMPHLGCACVPEQPRWRAG